MIFVIAINPTTVASGKLIMIFRDADSRRGRPDDVACGADQGKVVGRDRAVGELEGVFQPDPGSQATFRGVPDCWPAAAALTMDQQPGLVAHLFTYCSEQRVGLSAAIGGIETIRQLEKHSKAVAAVR